MASRTPRPSSSCSTGVKSSVVVCCACVGFLLESNRSRAVVRSISEVELVNSLVGESGLMSRAAFRGPLPASPAPSPASPVLKSPNLSSSPLMSVSAQSHVSSNNLTSSQASPPSSAPMSSQVSSQPTASASFPTPASSVMGSGDIEQMEKPVPAPVPAERTDHDRSLGETDAMDVDKTDRFGLDTLQKEFASAYHLCKRCKDFNDRTAVCD